MPSVSLEWEPTLPEEMRWGVINFLVTPIKSLIRAIISLIAG